MTAETRVLLPALPSLTGAAPPQSEAEPHAALTFWWQPVVRWRGVADGHS